MIELVDITLRETLGDFQETYSIMQNEASTEWMLESDAFISNELASARYLLHFWKNGRVVIYDTDRSTVLGSSDEDLRELCVWCKINGWKALYVDDRLITDRQGFDYWQTAFRAGLVESIKLQAHETEEVERLTKAYLKEKEEDNAPETNG